MADQRQSKPTADRKLAAIAAVPATMAAQLSATWLKGISDLQSEMTRFVLDRLQQDLETQRKMLACRSLKDVQNVQTGFMHHAAGEYVVEMSKVFAMGLQLTDKSTHGGDTVATTTKGM